MLELPSLEISLFTLASIVDSLGTHERILQNCKYHQPWLQILYSSSLDAFLVVGIIWCQCEFFLQASKDAIVVKAQCLYILMSTTTIIISQMAKKWWALQCLHQLKTSLNLWQSNLMAWKRMAKYGNGNLGKGCARSYNKSHNTVSAMGANNSKWWIYNVLMPTRNCEVVVEH